MGVRFLGNRKARYASSKYYKLDIAFFHDRRHFCTLEQNAVYTVTQHLTSRHWHWHEDFLGMNIWATTWQNQQNECAPSEDSDQPGHPPSLITIFAVRMKKALVLSYPLSAQRRLWSDWTEAWVLTYPSSTQRRLWSDQTGRMPRLIWVFAGLTVTLLVLSCRGSIMKESYTNQ